MSDAILVLNAGSSSLKFSLYDGPDLNLSAKGQIEGLGTAPHFVAKTAAGTVLAETHGERVGSRHAEALAGLSTWLEGYLEGRPLTAVGHRVVHGGPQYSAPLVVDADKLTELESFIPLAPLHQPHNLAGIRAVAEIYPDLPQVACFDTAFHRTHPPMADRFALPDEYYAAGVRRYGFHGLSYEYIAGALAARDPATAAGRVVVAHLGSGASMCALHNGQSCDSTMGFTALDGLPMGTRCGAIDPGVLLYLMEQEGMNAKALTDLLYKRSGLLGMSGVSNDLRLLQASCDPHAQEAIEYFVYRINRELGALAAALGGLDGLVFTAGIGENSALIREQVCRHAGWLGIELDEHANRQHGPRISTPASRVAVWVIPTDEELMIARHTQAAIS